MADLAGASAHMVGRREDTLMGEARRMMGVGAMKAIVGWGWSCVIEVETEKDLGRLEQRRMGVKATGKVMEMK